MTCDCSDGLINEQIKLIFVATFFNHDSSKCAMLQVYDFYIFQTYTLFNAVLPSDEERTFLFLLIVSLFALWSEVKACK